MRGKRATTRKTGRRGSTMLEVVLASLLLSSVAAAVVSVLAFVQSAEERRRQRLGCYEVANRLLLQYIDDAESMPDRTLPYDDGVYTYKWDLSVLDLTLDAPKDSIMEANSWGPAATGAQQAKLLDCKVWIAPRDATGNPVPSEQLAQITRIYYDWPLYSPNPDKRERWTSNPKNIEKITKAMMQGINQGGPATVRPPPGSPGAGGTTRPPITSGAPK